MIFCGTNVSPFPRVCFYDGDFVFYSSSNVLLKYSLTEKRVVLTNNDIVGDISYVGGEKS